MAGAFDVLNTPVDSERGIATLFEWAKTNGFVLNESHERIAIKHGVDLPGVAISRPIPIHRELPARPGSG